MSAVLAVTPARPTLVRAVCVREWREALGNKLLVGMTLLPPVVILVAGITAVAAAAPAAAVTVIMRREKRTGKWLIFMHPS